MESLRKLEAQCSPQHKSCRNVNVRGATMTIITKWIKTGNANEFVCLGKEILATASGNYVVFYNLLTREEKIEYFYSPTRGEGACCLAGHPAVPIFSTSERCHRPKIYIHTYPDIEKVAECRLDGDPTSYVSCCFVGDEYLVSLTSHPGFRLIVWFWRTGEKFSSTDTPLAYDSQSILASPSPSRLLYQFSPESGNLLTHEIHRYCKNRAVVTNRIELSERRIACVSWTKKADLLVCDTFHNVFVVSSDGTRTQMIVCNNKSIDGDKEIFIISINNGFVMLDDGLHLVRYRKSLVGNSLGENWTARVIVKLTFRATRMMPTRQKEAILLYSVCGQVYELCLTNEDRSELTEIRNNWPKIELLCPVNPEKVYGIVLDCFNCLMLINLCDGGVCAKFQLDNDDKAISMDTHPYIPFLSAVTSSGKCICLAVTKAVQFKALKTMHLQREPLYGIKFSQSGNVMGVTSRNPRSIYLLETIVNKDIEVIVQISVDDLIADFLIFDRDDVLRVLTLLRTREHLPFGNCIQVYSINKSNTTTDKSYRIYGDNYYQSMCFDPESTYDFVGVPHLSKHLHFFKFQNNYESISLYNIVSPGHSLRKFRVDVSRETILTSGLDGSVILRERLNLLEATVNFMACHYQERGTKQSILAMGGKVIVCLGENGSLLALQIGELKKQKVKDGEEMEGMEFACADSEELVVSEGRTWIERKEAEKLRKEEVESSALKRNILFDLGTLRMKIRELLNLNERKDRRSQLPVSMFDLNSVRREERMSAALRHQEETELSLVNESNRVAKVIDYLTTKFSDAFEVERQTLRSFNDNILVDNFPLRYSNVSAKIDDFFIDLFDTPLSNTNAGLSNDKEICSRLALLSISKASSLPSPTLEGESSSNDDVLCGSSSFKWITGKTCSPTRSMEPDYDVIVTSKEYKLKVVFNEMFDEIREGKDKLLGEIADRLTKLTDLNRQLKDLFGIVVPIESKWQSVVMSRCITKTEEDVGYNATSGNEYANRQIVFRKEKLKEMMDGVLERRWEDELRMDVSKPRCLIQKSPAECDEDEIKTAEAYREEVKKLEIQRKRYKRHLESEITRINDEIQSDVDKSDRELNELALKRIKIRSAMSQEYLLRLTGHGGRRSLYEGDTRERLTELEGKSETLRGRLAALGPIVSELKSKRENLLKREKLLDRRLRSELSKVKQPGLDHLLREYERRGRIDNFLYTSTVCLAEMGRCLATGGVGGGASGILPQEYRDFLRAAEAMDRPSAGSPIQIDDALWRSFCKLRRAKVDSEIKMRIATTELADAERTRTRLQKSRASISGIIEEAGRVRCGSPRDRNETEVQLVLKSERVECQMSGCPTDLEGAIILTRDRFTVTNEAVLEEGKKMIVAMRARTSLRKCMALTEWECRCAATRVKHLKERLKTLRNTRISKEMRGYLTERLKGGIDGVANKYSASYKRCPLMSVEKKFARMLREKEADLSRLITEMKDWRGRNAELTRRLEELRSKKIQLISRIESDELRRRNENFKESHLRSVAKRLRLVGSLEANHMEILYLQNQLEVLKWRTYPTLRRKLSPPDKKLA